MNSYIKSVKVEGLHRTDTYLGKDFELEFGPGVNVVYGLNGSGKTTLLHILANLCNDDVQKFQFIEFSEMSLMNGDRQRVKINKEEGKTKFYLLQRDGSQDEIYLDIHDTHDHRRRQMSLIDDFLDSRESIRSSSSERLRTYLPTRRPLSERKDALGRLQKSGFPSVAYFPAFRSISEVQRPLQEDFRPSRMYRNIQDEIFGPFTPETTDTLSLPVIKRRLGDEVRQAVSDVARKNQAILTRLSFDILSTLKQPDGFRTEIQQSVDKLQNTQVYSWLPEVATTYNLISQNPNSDKETRELYIDALEDILKEQTDRFDDIEKFQTNVNKFLINKDLVIRPEENTNRAEIGIRRDGDSELIDISTMSSGERQIFSLLHAVSFLGEHDLVLIDEPELSLHIDWQHKLPRSMSEILRDKQLIVCTHSPEIFSGFEKVEGARTIELDPVHVH